MASLTTVSLSKAFSRLKGKPEGVKEALSMLDNLTPSVLPLHAMVLADWPEIISAFDEGDWLPTFEASHKGQCLLHLGAAASTATLKELLKKGVDEGLFRLDDDGFSALMCAVLNGNTANAKLLVIAGSDVDQPHIAGEYCSLHFALQTKNKEMVEYLISAGADTSLVDLEDYRYLSSDQEGSDILDLVEDAQKIRSRMGIQRFKTIEVFAEDSARFVLPEGLRRQGDTLVVDVLLDMTKQAAQVVQSHVSAQEKSLSSKVSARRLRNQSAPAIPSPQLKS